MASVLSFADGPMVIRELKELEDRWRPHRTQVYAELQP